jgi:hypothetical protein
LHNAIGAVLNGSRRLIFTGMDLTRRIAKRAQATLIAAQMKHGACHRLYRTVCGELTRC